MKKLIVVLLLTVVSLSYAGSYLHHTLGTCTGAKNCTVCKNCKYCKHCKKDGGTCGVCKK